jgi:hypothetical protein
VKLGRKPHGVLTAADLLPGPPADLVQVGQVLLGGPGADQRDDPDFHNQPDLGDVGGCQRGQAQQVGQAVKDVLAGGDGHEGTAARGAPDLDQAARFQHPQRLARGVPADAEALTQLPLGREAVARPELALAHQLANLIDDRPGDPAYADFLEQSSLGEARGFARGSIRHI